MKRTTSTIGLQFVLCDGDEPDDMPEPVSRVFALTIAELRRMVDVLNSLGAPPAGFLRGVRAVRQCWRSTSVKGLQFMLVDGGKFRKPLSRVFLLTIPELRAMVESLDYAGGMPSGFTLEVRAVRRKRRVSLLKRFPHIWRRLK